MLEALLIPTKREKLAARHLSEHTYRRLAAPAGTAMQPEAMGAPVAAEAALTGMAGRVEMAATAAVEADALAAIAAMVVMAVTAAITAAVAAELTALMQLPEPEVPEELMVAMGVMPLRTILSLVVPVPQVPTRLQ